MKETNYQRYNLKMLEAFFSEHQKYVIEVQLGLMFIFTKPMFVRDTKYKSINKHKVLLVSCVEKHDSNKNKTNQIKSRFCFRRKDTIKICFSTHIGR